MNEGALSTRSGGWRLAILVVVLAAFALRCALLDRQELRGDEAFGYFFSLNSPQEIVEQTIALREPHPVASYWLQHEWLALAGESEFGLRFAGVWWSVVAVALMAALATRLRLPHRVSVIAAALMALSPYMIWHAQDARMYSMSLALTLASTLLALVWWQATRTRQTLWASLGTIGVTLFALHTHYFAVYVVLAQQITVIGWAANRREWRKLARWWGVGFVTLLLWTPWLISAWGTLTGYDGNGDSPGLFDAVTRAHSAFVVGDGITSGRAALATLALAAVVVGVWNLWRRKSSDGSVALWLLIPYWLVPLAATWLSAQSRPIFNERYLIAGVPPTYLLMALATLGIARGQTGDGRAWLRWLLPALVVGGMGWGLWQQWNDPALSKTRGWRELAATLSDLVAGVDPERVRLAQNYPDPTLWYYYRGDVPHLVLPPLANDANLAQGEVETLVEQGVTRLLLIEQPASAWDGSGIAARVLAQYFAPAGRVEVGQWPVSIWLNTAEELYAMDVGYVDGLRLTGISIEPTRLHPGSVIAVHLQWQLEVDGEGARAVSVQLLNDQGQLVAQSDRRMEMASDTTAQVESYAILVPHDMEAGRYALHVVVYDPDSEGAPRLRSVDGRDNVQVGQFVLDAE